MKIFLIIFSLFLCSTVQATGQGHEYQKHRVLIGTAHEIVAVPFIAMADTDHKPNNNASNTQEQDVDGEQDASLLPNWVYFLILGIALLALLMLVNLRLRKIIVNASGPLLSLSLTTGVIHFSSHALFL